MRNWIGAGAALAVATVAGWARPALACDVDTDCPCGQVCSWNQTLHACVDASGGDPGWCTSATSCLYEGQTCSGNACTPAWTSGSVCDKAGGTTGGTTGGGTTGGAAGGGTSGGSSAGATGSATGGTTTSSGPSSSGGGCSSAGGSFALCAGLFAAGLLVRRRRP